MKKDKLCKLCNKMFTPRKGYTRRRCPDCPFASCKNVQFENLKKDATRKKRLILERGYACEVCKLSKWMEKNIPLELDHVDGHPGHNDKNNLRLVCPNCHAQTEYYKGANVGRHKDTDRQKTFSKYPDYRKLKTGD